MPGTLFVVATPIGNLEDITLRALGVLRAVRLIAAEDTRRTGKLLTHFGIRTGTISFHAHNWRNRLRQLLQRLHGGESIALVTDAGTPGISDPGSELVRACLDEGVRIEPVPGVSAPIAAAMISGFPLVPLTILGFVPSRAKDRTRWLASLADVPNTLTFFEAPHRILATLREASGIWGERHIMLCRELTKMHQELLHGTASTIVGQLVNLKGEFTIVAGPIEKSLAHQGIAVTDDVLAHEFGRLIETGATSRRAAIAAVAKAFGRPRRAVYAAVEKSKE
jgi:16S rRNA (cytidine1402-2'-O)-methyltransferase